MDVPKLCLKRDLLLQLAAMKVANKDLKGTMKTLKIEDIDVRSSIFMLYNLILLLVIII